MYTQKTGHLTASAAQYTSATSSGFITAAVTSACRISRIMAVVTITTGSGAATVLQCVYQPTYGSGSGATILGTLTVPSGTVAGQCVYKDVSPSTELIPGGEIIWNVKTASGQAVGQVVIGQEVLDNPENALAQTKMVASA